MVVLLLWIGFVQTQALAVDHYPTMAECQRAAAALVAYDSRLDAKCLPAPDSTEM